MFRASIQLPAKAHPVTPGCRASCRTALARCRTRCAETACVARRCLSSSSCSAPASRLDLFAAAAISPIRVSIKAIWSSTTLNVSLVSRRVSLTCAHSLAGSTPCRSFWRSKSCKAVRTRSRSSRFLQFCCSSVAYSGNDDRFLAKSFFSCSVRTPAATSRSSFRRCICRARSCRCRAGMRPRISSSSNDANVQFATSPQAWSSAAQAALKATVAAMKAAEIHLTT